jgi:hypothetical protein
MSWLFLGISPLHHSIWTISSCSSAFASISSSASINVLDIGVVSFAAENSLLSCSFPEKLSFHSDRLLSTYFEVSVESLQSSMAMLSVGFSEPRRAPGNSLVFSQRCACSISISSFSISCNGSLVPDIPAEFVAIIKEHGKDKGTVVGVHLDLNAACITFSVAAFASPVATSATEVAASEFAMLQKAVPTKLVRYSVPWKPTAKFQPVVDLMQGSVLLNTGERPFLLEVPSGATALLSEIQNNVRLSRPMATLLTAYVDDKSNLRNCQQTVTSALVDAINHVFSEAYVQPPSFPDSASANHSLMEAFTDREHEVAVLTNLLKDQDIFSALFRASQEQELIAIFNSTILSILATPSNVASNGTHSASLSDLSTSSPHDGPSSTQPAAPTSASECAQWVRIASALNSLPHLEAAVPSTSLPANPTCATPGTEDFSSRALSTLFDNSPRNSPPPSPRNLSPVPRASSLPLADDFISADIFQAKLLATRSKFAAWLFEHICLQATSALLGISDAQSTTDSPADSAVSAASIWQNVFANFIESMCHSIPRLLSCNASDQILRSFCLALQCAGAVVAVKNVSVSFLGCLLNFLESSFAEIRIHTACSITHVLLTRIPSYVLACSAQYSIDRNSNKNLDASILQHLHNPVFDGGFLESFSRWKFLDDFGSRQSGVSGTRKAVIALSSFYEELSSDSKSGSVWLSIFSLAVVKQGVSMNGTTITSRDDPIFKSEAFTAALSAFLHITGFAEFCSSVPNTPDHIRQPICPDTLRQLNPELFCLWGRFFTEIVEHFISIDSQSTLLSHCRLCLSLAPPSAAVDDMLPSQSMISDLSPTECMLERRISGSSVVGADKYVAELINYLNSSVDDKLLKSIAAERDFILQSRSFGFQILRKLLELVQLTDDKFTLDFCRSMLCCVEMCFAPIVASERGSAHVVVGLSGTTRKSQQRMQFEWTQLMHCVLDTTHKVISEQSVGSSEVLPLGFLLLNLFQQDAQWLSYGGKLIDDIFTIASGIHSPKRSPQSNKLDIKLLNSQDFPAEAFAACAIADGEWLCHGGVTVIDGVRTIFSGFWFIQDGQYHAVKADHDLPRAWHTLTKVQSDSFLLIGGASAMLSSGSFSKAKVALVKVQFDRSTMSVKLEGVSLIGFRSPVMHSAVVVSESPISPKILVIGGLGRAKTSAMLICISVPESMAFDTSQIASTRRRASGTRRMSPPPPSSSPPRPSVSCISAPVNYVNKVFDVSPLSLSRVFRICFGCKPAVHRIPGSSQVIVSSVAFESSASQILCFHLSSNSPSWSIIPLEGWPMNRHSVVGSSFVPLQDGSLLLVGGEDEATGDIADPVIISLGDFTCEVLCPIPEPLQFSQHHSNVSSNSISCDVLGNWRLLPQPLSCLSAFSFNLNCLRGSMKIRGLRSVLSGLCAQAVLVPDKGFKVPVLSPLLWSLQAKRLKYAHEQLKIMRESIPALPACINIIHEAALSVCDSFIGFLAQNPQLIGFWFSMKSFSKFSGSILSIGANGISLCSLEVDACRFLIMRSVSGVSISPSPLPSNCWVHIAVSFLPATIPQFCLYLNGCRLVRQDGCVSPIKPNLRSKDLGVAYGNKHFVLCVGHRQGTDNTAEIRRVCLQMQFEFSRASCFDMCSVAPPCASTSSTLELDILSIIQSMRSVPTSTLSHFIQNDTKVLVLLLDMLFTGSVSLAGPCALMLVSLINEFPSFYTPEFLDSLLSEPFAEKLCKVVRTQSQNHGSIANRHHRNIQIFLLRELMHASASAFQLVVSRLLIDQLTSAKFDGDAENCMISCYQTLALLDVFSNRLCVFPGLEVLVSPSPSSPSTRCVVMHASSEFASLYIKYPHSQSCLCETHPISHLQNIKSGRNDVLVLPLTLLSPFLCFMSCLLTARSHFQHSIALSAVLDTLFEHCLKVISGTLASENSIDLSSFTESFVSQLLDLSFQGTSDFRSDENLHTAIVDICVGLGWTVSKSAMPMAINPSDHVDPVKLAAAGDVDPVKLAAAGDVDPVKLAAAGCWMQVGPRPMFKSRHPADSTFHLGVNIHSKMKLKVGLISSAAIRTVCNSLKGNSPPQAMVPLVHPYRRAIFQVTGELFQPLSPASVAVEDCLSFKLTVDGPRSIVSQNACTATEGLFCSFALKAKDILVVGLVPNTQLHLANQQIEVEPLFFVPKVGQYGTSGSQFRAVISRGRELSGWKEGLTITIIADPSACVVSAFVEENLVNAFRCDCRDMRVCIS